jgi:hypothetical protein
VKYFTLLFCAFLEQCKMKKSRLSLNRSKAARHPGGDPAAAAGGSPAQTSGASGPKIYDLFATAAAPKVCLFVKT